MKSDGFRLPLKMKCKQVVYRSVYQNCGNYQLCKSVSVGFYFLLVKCALKCGVDHTRWRTSASLIYERFHGH